MHNLSRFFLLVLFQFNSILSSCQTFEASIEISELEKNTRRSNLVFIDSARLITELKNDPALQDFIIRTSKCKCSFVSSIVMSYINGEFVIIRSNMVSSFDSLSSIIIPRYFTNYKMGQKNQRNTLDDYRNKLWLSMVLNNEDSPYLLISFSELEEQSTTLIGKYIIYF